jgi:hypothetical protein
MKCRQLLLLFFVIVLIFPAAAHAQLWSGVINPNRAINWAGAGLPGSTLPDAGWPVCTTISAYAGSGATISNALTSCQSANPKGGVVVLGAGTFTLSSGIDFPQNTTGHVALRGSGANSTFINFTGGGATTCNPGGAGFICASGGDGTYPGGTPAASGLVYTTWTGNYGKGTTQLTLGSVSGITPGKTLLILEQCDTGFAWNGSANAGCTGSANDNLGYFICSTPWTANSVGCNAANESADGPAYRTNGWQMEGGLVTAINQGGCGATCVTISNPIMHPNWSAGQSPIAILVQVTTQQGIENFSINGPGTSGSPDGVYFYTSYNLWVSGIRATNFYAHSIHFFQVFNSLIKDSYFYGNPGNYNDSTGAHPRWGGMNLIQNNICQQVKICGLIDGGGEAGDVFAYNYSVDQYLGASSNDYMWPAFDWHASGNDLILLEGNMGNKANYDLDHGGHVGNTMFRNFFWGYESCVNGATGGNNCGGNSWKGSGAIPFTSGYDSRYGAEVANVLGMPGFHTTYKWEGSFPTYTNQFGSNYIYILGAGNQGNGQNQPADPYAYSDSAGVSAFTEMAWANWDVVNNATQYNASEVPTNAATYPNSVPTACTTSAACPQSFYLSGEPSWFGSAAWPPIGPDVTGGNIAQCTGTLSTANGAGAAQGGLPTTTASVCGTSATTSAWGGHVSANPAMACYFSMGGLPDGTNPRPLPFNPSTCYGGSSTSGGAPPPPAPNPPTHLIVTVN